MKYLKRITCVTLILAMSTTLLNSIFFSTIKAETITNDVVDLSNSNVYSVNDIVYFTDANGNQIVIDCSNQNQLTTYVNDELVEFTTLSEEGDITQFDYSKNNVQKNTYNVQNYAILQNTDNSTCSDNISACANVTVPSGYTLATSFKESVTGIWVEGYKKPDGYELSQKGKASFARDMTVSVAAGLVVALVGKEVITTKLVVETIASAFGAYIVTSKFTKDINTTVYYKDIYTKWLSVVNNAATYYNRQGIRYIRVLGTNVNCEGTKRADGVGYLGCHVDFNQWLVSTVSDYTNSGVY